jgi:hypothetical protein
MMCVTKRLRDAIITTHDEICMLIIPSANLLLFDLLFLIILNAS